MVSTCHCRSVDVAASTLCRCLQHTADTLQNGTVNTLTHKQPIIASSPKIVSAGGPAVLLAVLLSCFQLPPWLMDARVLRGQRVVHRQEAPSRRQHGQRESQPPAAGVNISQKGAGTCTRSIGRHCTVTIVRDL